jgi:hypothetical protein
MLRVDPVHFSLEIGVHAIQRADRRTLEGVPVFRLFTPSFDDELELDALRNGVARRED